MKSPTKSNINKIACILAILGISASAAFADTVTVESRVTGTGVTSPNPPYLEIGGNWAPSSAKSTAPGCTATTGSRFDTTHTVTTGFKVTPTLGSANAVYGIYVTLATIATSASPDITCAVASTGGDLSTNSTIAFRNTSLNTWKFVGYITNNVANPSVTFTYASGTVDGSTGHRFFADAVQFRNIADVCLSGYAQLSTVNGPLAAGQTSVDVPGLNAAATAVTVYANGVPIGTNSSPTIVGGVATVTTFPLVKGQIIAATQTSNSAPNAVESCLSSTGPKVGGGANPRIRIALSIRENTGLTGPIGADGGTSGAKLTFLGSGSIAGGFGTAPAGGRVITPSTCWQTVSFLRGPDPAHSVDPTYGWSGAPASTDPLLGNFGILQGISFAIDDLTDTGPFNIYIDNIMNGSTLVQDFESASSGTSAFVFSVPHTDGNSKPFLLSQSPGSFSPDVSQVSNANADSGNNSALVSWQFKDTSVVDWMNLVTSGSGFPNPQVDLNQPISFRVLVLPVGQSTGNPSINITTQPVNQIVNPGDDVFETVAATGPGNLSCQWYKNGVAIQDAIDFHYEVVFGADASYAGLYYAVITSDAPGTCIATSSVVSLGVNGTGTGLNADYYSNTNLANPPTLTRLDSTVNNDWALGSPDPSIPVDNFGVRWTGKVTPYLSETYTFYTTTDDGVRLYVNGVLIINKWIDQGATEWSGSIALTANQTYDIVMEYYEHGVSAVAKLSWSSPHTAKAIIPATQLSTVPVAFVSQPSDATAPCGTSASLSSSATGSGVQYQWLKAGAIITGAVNNTLNFPSAQCSDSGSYTVVISNSGGSVTSSPPATLTITDTTAPTITCVPDKTGECGAWSFDAPSASDNCGIPVVTIVSTVTNNTGVCPIRYEVTRTWLATDGCGNTATCSQKVTVQDTTAPVIVCSTNIVLSADGGQCSKTNVTYTVTATDACDSNPSLVCIPASGSTFALGTNTVNCTSTDSCLNTSLCSFTVVILDTEVPAITCPGNIVVSTSGGACSSNVTFTATASDNCPGVLSACVPASGSSFAKGVTSVTCSATDASGNTNACTFTVTVNDTEKPAIACPANIAQSTDAGLCTAVVSFATPAATDNCPGDVTVACLPASGSAFAKGATIVTCTATDANGNTNACTFTVTVNDTEPPVIGACPANIVKSTDAGLCTAVTAFTVPGATDNCPGVTVACSPTNGFAFPKGVNTVICTATGSSGNTSTCSFTVTVNDTQVPTIVCSPSVQTNLTAGCTTTVTFTNPIVSDNCPGATFACVPANGSTFSLGATTVTCTATDSSGNTNACTFTVTVTAAAPSITAQPQNQTTPMGNGTVFSVTAAGTSTLGYQWQSNTVNIAGATASSLAISNLNIASTGNFRVIISNCAGSITSQVATLTVTPITGISFDFNTPGQYDHLPFNLVNNDWMEGFNGGQLAAPGAPFEPSIPFEVSTGGVGVATGGGALDLQFNNGTDNTSLLLPVTYDFSAAGKTLNVSVMTKLKVPTAAQRAIEIGFITATNIPGNATPVVSGLNGQNGTAWGAAVFQSVVVNSINPTYQLLTQSKSVAAGGTATTLTPINTVTNTAGLTTNNWYKIVAQFVNTKGAAGTVTASNYTIAISVQDMGLNGITPGTNVAVLPATLMTNVDLVNASKLYFAMRLFENGGLDYLDNIFITTQPGALAVVSPVASPSILQGRPAYLQALVDGDGPYAYQWFKNGTAIPGAAQWKYATPPLTLSDNGAQFSVTVTGTNSSISSTGTVTVVPDALAVLSVGSVDGGVIGLRFNQAVDKTSAETAANYTVNGTAAIGAQLLALNGVQQNRTNGTELLLTPASPISGSFTVAVANVTSLSGTVIGAGNTATGLVAGLTGLDVDPQQLGAQFQVPTLPGYSYSFAPGQFTIIAGGHDIFGTFDGFRYTYKQVTGDFDIKVRISYMDIFRASQKAGFDVRVSLDPTSPNVGSFADAPVPAFGTWEGTVRQTFGAASTSWIPGTRTTEFFPNAWLRLRRVGNTFIRYTSTNGVNWAYDAQVSPFPGFPATVYFGLANNCNVGAFNLQELVTSQMDSFGDFPGYVNPTIAITTQPGGSTVAAGSAATITAVATLSTNGVLFPATGELAYLWQRTNTGGGGGWTNMPSAGATNNILNTGNLYFSDNGAQYRVIISAPGAVSVTSATAIITVTDTAAATVNNSFSGNLGPNQLVLNFSEPLSAASALNAANYSVTNGGGVRLTILGVNFLRDDPRTVIINTLEPVASGTNFVQITGVQDLNGNALTTLRTIVNSSAYTPTVTSAPQNQGPVVMEWYTSISSYGGMHELVNANNYRYGSGAPNGTPDFIVYSNVFGVHPGSATGAGFPSSGWAENYGVKMYSYFRPPTTASTYKMYLRVDDFAELWMNTNADPNISKLGLDLVVPTTTNSPVTQNAWMAMDGVVSNYANSKYLNFDKLNTGFYVTPAVSNTVVGGIRFWAASDTPQRDPTTFTLAGSVNTGTNGPWIPIAADVTGLYDITNQPNTGRYFPTNIVFTNINASGTYTNTTPYRSYRVIFPTIRDTAANSMQIGEVQFLGTNANNPVVVPSGATMLVQQTVNSGTYSAANSSSNLTLNAGQLYYMEMRFHEGGGGDGGTVAFRTDTTVPTSDQVISNQFLVFPTNFAPVSTPLQFEAYMGLQPVGDMNGGPTATVGLNQGNLPDLLYATNLTNFIARIPNIAGYTEIMGFHTNRVSVSAALDNYLGRVYAYFIAPSNGVYKFYVDVDDTAQLLMNTNAVNSTDPAGLTVLGQIYQYGGTSGQGGITNGAITVAGGSGTMTLIASNITLVGNQRYYMEVRFRDGTGGDGFTLAMRSQGDPSAPGQFETIPASFFEMATNEVRFGPIKLAGITPSAPTVVEGQSLRLQAVGVSGAGSAQGSIANIFASSTTAAGANTVEAVPLLISPGFVWMKNGTDIFRNQVFAGQMYYLTPPLTLADNNSTISLLVSNSFSVATQTVTIHVTPASAPTLVSAVASQFGDTLLVTFNGIVDPTTSQQLANYALSGGLKVLSVKRDDVRADRVSLKTSRQAPVTVYTLTVNNVKNATGTQTIAANSSINFSSWGAGGSGGVYVELFTNMFGSLDEFLINSPKFALNMPDVSYYTNDFGVGRLGLDSGNTYYAGRVSSVFTPPSNGLYRFFVRGDDGTRLYMNTNGSDPAGKVLIARNDGAGSGSYTPLGDTAKVGYQTGTGLGRIGTSISPILSLTNGTGYWLEAMFKEGTGGDYLEVVMRAIDSNPASPTYLQEINGVPAVPANGVPSASDNNINAANGQMAFFGAPGNPDVLGIASGPASETNVLQNTPLTLQVVAKPPGVAAGYQWSKSTDTTGTTFTNIPGATSATFSQNVDLPDDHFYYKITVSLPAGLTPSMTTLLHVIPDHDAPYIVSVGSLDGLTIGICFSERVNFSFGQPASDPAYYQINDGTPIIGSIVPRADQKSAIIVLDPSTPISGAFTVDALQFADLAGNQGGEFSDTGCCGLTNGTVMGLSAFDVGGPAQLGSTFTCKDGEFDVLAGGADIWGTSDQGHLTLGPRTGNFDVKVRFQSLTVRSASPDIDKMGLMVRETTNLDSRTLYTSVNPPLALGGRDQGEPGFRDLTAGATATWNGAGSTTYVPVGMPNAWQRITRVGNLFTAYRSSDGINWTAFANITTVYPETVQAGVATTAHNNAVPATFGQYRNFHFVPAPVFTSTPANLTVVTGHAASFSGSATADAEGGALTYQWRHAGTNIPGATSTTLNIAAATPADAGVYDLVATTSGGNPRASATLTVLVPPTISQPPVDVTASCASSADFSVTASGMPEAGPLGYQWLRDGNPINGEVGSTLHLASVGLSDSGKGFSVIVTNGGGGVTSIVAVLTVIDTTAPVITCPSDFVGGCSSGGSIPVTFSVTATDNCGGAPVINCTPASGSSFPVGPTLVNCSATDASNNVNNCSFTVTVNQSTSAAAMANQTNCIGSSVTFGTVAAGTGPLTYSWASNGVVVAGANANSFTINPVSSGAAVSYCVIVQGACNSVTNCASLTVVGAPSITSQPQPSMTSVGNGTLFSVIGTNLNTTVYGLTYQWQTNGVDIANGPSVTGATAATLTFSNATLAANGLLFSVKVTDCSGTTTSSSALLTVVAANDFVTKASQGANTAWTAAIWSNPPNTTVSSPVAGNTYELLANGTAWGYTGGSTANTRTRNPATDGLQTFPGDSLTVNTNTDIRFKKGAANTPISATISAFPGVGGNPGLILKGGILNAGDDSEFVVTGNVYVASQSILTSGDNGGGAQKELRSIFLRGKLSGPGNLVILQSGQGTPHQVDADGSGYSGNWIIQDGFLQGLGSNSLGNGTISILVTPTNQLAAANGTNYSKVEVMYDLITVGSLVLSNNAVSGAPAVMVLHQNLVFGSAVINGTSLARGVYTYAQLAAAYPSNFAAGGSGTITVGPAPVTLRNELRSGNNFSASFPSQPGVNYLVEYTDSLLPVSWQTLQNIVGDGTLKSFTDTGATGATRYYRVTAQ